MIWSSVLRRRSRVVVALLAITVGATILSGLVMIYRDVPRQMGAEFRNYGANMIFLASSHEADFSLKKINEAVSEIDPAELVGVAPYRYEAVKIHEQPVVAAGTDLDGVKLTSPYWYIDGEWPTQSGETILGREEANYLGLKVGDKFDMAYTDESEEAAIEAEEGGEERVNQSTEIINDSTMKFTVVGILETGGSEEDYAYISLEDLEALTGSSSDMDLVELSISADSQKLNTYIDKISDCYNP